MERGTPCIWCSVQDPESLFASHCDDVHEKIAIVARSLPPWRLRNPFCSDTGLVPVGCDGDGE